MKKFIYTLFAMVLVLATLLVSCQKADIKDDNTQDDSYSASGKVDNITANAAAITEVDAKKAALTHAGVNEDDVRFVKVEMDKDDGVIVYEVEFLVGNKEYDYEIDASNGKVLGCDFEIESAYPSVQEPTSPTYITDERAKEIALTDAGLKAADVKVILIKLENDDGKTVYDVDFYHNNTEYDYEIDAVTGQILQVERDEKKNNNASSVGNTSNTNTSSDYIGKDAAKAKAFAHAGVKEADARNVEVELEKDNGRWEYEVEFEVGNIEYTYEIDAVTGVILEHEIDRD